MQGRGLGDGEQGWMEPLMWQLTPPSPPEQGPRELQHRSQRCLASRFPSWLAARGSQAAPAILPLTCLLRFLTEEQKSPSDAGFRNTDSSFSHILHLNAYWHEAVTDTTPYHPYPMPHILSFSRKVSLGTSHSHPIPARNSRARGHGRWTSILNA